MHAKETDYLEELRRLAEQKNERLQKSQKDEQTSFSQKQKKEQAEFSKKAGEDKAKLEEAAKKRIAAVNAMEEVQKLEQEIQLQLKLLELKIKLAKKSGERVPRKEGKIIAEQSIEKYQEEIKVLNAPIKEKLTGDAKTRIGDLYPQYRDYDIVRSALNKEFENAYNKGGVGLAKYKKRTSNLSSNNDTNGNPKPATTATPKPDTAVASIADRSWKSRLFSSGETLRAKVWSNQIALHERIKSLKVPLSMILEERRGFAYEKDVPELISFTVNSPFEYRGVICLLADICKEIKQNMHAHANNNYPVNGCKDGSINKIISGASEYNSHLVQSLNYITINKDTKVDIKVAHTDLKDMLSYINKNWVWIHGDDISEDKRDKWVSEQKLNAKEPNHFTAHVNALCKKGNISMAGYL